MRVAGRVKSLRSSGAKLKFYDLAEGDDRVQAPSTELKFRQQVMCSPQMHEGEDFKEVHGNIHRGVPGSRCNNSCGRPQDIIGVRGVVGKSKRGELSIFPKEVKLLSPCLHMLPKDYSGFPTFCLVGLLPTRPQRSGDSISEE